MVLGESQAAPHLSMIKILRVLMIWVEICTPWRVRIPDAVFTHASLKHSVAGLMNH